MCPTNPLGTVDVYLVSHHGSDTRGRRLSSMRCSRVWRS